MPHFADYELYLCDFQGDQVILLSGNEMLDFTWTHVLNGPGSYKCTLVAESGIQDSFKKHYGLKLMRDYGDGFYEEYYGFHLKKNEYMITDEDQADEHYWESEGLSPEWLLDQPLIWPMKSSNPNYGYYDLWWDGGTSDDVMKRMASESLGGGAETDRQFTSFVVEGNNGAGVWSCFEARYDRLLQSMQEISGDEYEADFRVVRTDTGFELRTYAPFYGTDRRRGVSSDPTIFSLELANMRNPEHTVDWRNEVTYLIGGWQGTRAGRALYYAQDATAIAETPFSRREDFVDLRDVSSPGAIADRMTNELYNRRKVEEVTFELLQTDACLYGRDWALGDLVTLDLWGYTYDMRIVEVDGRIDGDNEETIVGVAELYGDGNIQPIYTIEPEVPVYTVLAAAREDVWASYDSGVTWTFLATIAGANQSNDLLQLSSGDILIAAGGAGGAIIQRSQNDGVTWAASVVPAGEDLTMSLCETNAGSVLAGTATDANVWRSTDDGANFAFIVDTTQSTLSSFVVCNDGKIVAGARRQIWRSANDGVNWAFVTNIAGVGVYVQCLVKATNGDLVAGTGTSSGQVYVSDDDGDTWTLKQTIVGETYVGSLAIDTAGTIWAGTYGHAEVWKSTNNGQNWAQVGSIAGESNIPAICALPDGTLLAGAAAGGKVYRSTDGGATWTQVMASDETSLTAIIRLV